MGLIERQAVDRAFRAGLLGGEAEGARGLREDAGCGAGELAVMGTRRMPGLDDPDAAYETGRVLRLVARLFDKAGAPRIVAEQFRDNLAGAVMTHHMRRSGISWQVDDSIAMFIEMHERMLGTPTRDLDRVATYLRDKARKPAAASKDTPGWRGFGLRAA